ncbi:class I SAM-dependent methyltransferase [Roseibium sp.]|uniref:class I SAM-dependent methyltransferase n=1 Tax=Roseibium sp. TaxID=1936156 RepID=UPI003D118315
MSEPSRQSHWENVYTVKAETDVSWFEANADVSLDLISRYGADKHSLIDIGGGASRLVDALLAEGKFHEIAVLDLSSAALDVAKKRIGPAARAIEWIAEDVTRWTPVSTYDIWHDRAAFHFLTDAADRTAYVTRLKQALNPGGLVIIATFAPDGPERCSGLPVVRYNPEALAKVLGPDFELVDERSYVHKTPWGAEQSFQFSVLRRIA